MPAWLDRLKATLRPPAAPNEPPRGIVLDDTTRLPGERIDTDTGFVWDTKFLTTFKGADIQIVLVKDGEARSFSVIVEGESVSEVWVVPHYG